MSDAKACSLLRQVDQYYSIEIGDLPLPQQVKLLRVLAAGALYFGWDVRPKRCNVRMMAATHQTLPRKLLRETFDRICIFVCRFRDCYARASGSGR